MWPGGAALGRLSRRCSRWRPHGEPLLNHPLGEFPAALPGFQRPTRLRYGSRFAGFCRRGRVALGYLILVYCEGAKDFFLLALRDLDEIQGASELPATSSNSAGEILKPRCASSRPSLLFPGFVEVYWNGPPEAAHPPCLARLQDAGAALRVRLRPSRKP